MPSTDRIRVTGAPGERYQEVLTARALEVVAELQGLRVVVTGPRP